MFDLTDNGRLPFPPERPQPPVRPDTLHWLYGVSADRAQQLACATPQELQFLYDLSEESRCEYELALMNYLVDLRDERFLFTLQDMAVYYRTYAYEGSPDPNWKRGGTG